MKPPSRKFLFLLPFFILLGACFYSYQEYSLLKSISTYDQCAVTPGSIIQESYPATCITRYGKKFTQIITPPSYYVCPKSEWADCMPNPDAGIKFECTSDYLDLAKQNCPGFQGAAL